MTSYTDLDISFNMVFGIFCDFLSHKNSVSVHQHNELILVIIRV